MGAESSGTTAVSNLLFVGRDDVRFFDEGDNRWVWRAYQSIHQGLAKVEDYPRLQLYDALKVPGFAMILEQYRKAFPRSKIIYCLRDPRDVLNSAYYTWKLRKPEELSTIPWVRQTWLGLTASDPVERLALRWKSYLNNASEIEDVVFVRYEDFWAAPLSSATN